MVWGGWVVTKMNGSVTYTAKGMRASAGIGRTEM
jgi:hypothetical protein